MVIPNLNRTAEEDALIAASRSEEVSLPAQSGSVGRALSWLPGVPLCVLVIAYLIFHH